MKSPTNFLIIATGTLICTTTVSASWYGTWPTEPGYIYTSTPASELWGAGFDNLTEDGNLEVVPAVICNDLVLVPSYTNSSVTQHNAEAIASIDSLWRS